jgi:TusA-related sulfurtransferase
MAVTVDTRGLSCPTPQQMTMQAIRQARAGDQIIVLADEGAARDSIIRTARALQLPYRMERLAGEYKIFISMEELWREKK